MHSSRTALTIASMAIAVVVVATQACLNFGECSVDEDCSGGDVCSGGACVECEADSDCDDGETCQENSCEASGAGSGGGDVEVGCDADEDCPEGETCDVGEGTCVAPPVGFSILCCFARDGVAEAFECADETAAAQCNDGATDACALNPERNDECGAGADP